MRKSNEDSYTANLEHRLFVVADGMGGHVAGEVASQIAASTMEEMLASSVINSVGPEEALRRAVESANARVYETQRAKPELAGMGSTLTALSFYHEHYYVVHIGDSRAYLYREGALDQLTRDHSLVWHLFETGVLRKDELSSHPQKNLITRSVGPHPQLEVDIETGEVSEGDVYLLCSDGLTDVVSDSKIREILADPTKTPQQMGETLVDEANLAGGPDNVTVVVVRLEPGNEQQPDTGAPRAV